MRISKAFTRFLRDERASITVEAVLVMPLMLWGYFGLFVLFEGYRALSSNIRAGYSISDMISRETDYVTPAYIEGLNDIQDVLTQSPHRTVLRVTVVKYDEDDDDHTLQWSYSTEGKSAITAGDLDSEIIPYLPPMGDSSEMIVVETWVAFVPFLNITLKQLYDNDADPNDVVFGPFYFESIVTTRQRFGGGQLKFQSS